MSAPPVTTRTGRRVVLTPAAVAMQAQSASSSGSGNPSAKTTPGSSTAKAASPAPVKTPKVAAPKEDSSTPKPTVSTADAPKKRVLPIGGRSARQSSDSVDELHVKEESMPPSKKVRIELRTDSNKPQETIVTSTDVEVHSEIPPQPDPEPDTEVVTAESTDLKSDHTGDETQIIGIIEMNPSHDGTESTTGTIHQLDVDSETQVLQLIASTENETGDQTMEEQDVGIKQQKFAVESILPDNDKPIQIIVDETVTGDIEPNGVESETVFPPWNEQGCIICNVDIQIDDDPANTIKNHEKVKEFFLEFFSVGDQISLDSENTFPFCPKCAEDMESLLGISHKIEFMHKQFNKVRDSLSKKAIKTFLVRTKPSCLEEDAKIENYGFLDDDQKKSYKDQMFSLWKSRYELVQPGPKTPIMIRSMDSRGRVTVVRLNSQGQPIPEKLGNLKRFSVSGTDIPLGGMGRNVNGDDDGELISGSLDMYKCKDCPKTFSAKSMLAYHSRIHTGECPFECEICGKAFSVPHYLMTHMRSHTGERPFKCNECGKGFAQRGGLVTHSLVHTGAKPYSCEICGKSFRQKYHLTQHNLIHSGVKPFSCELCGKCFNVKMNLREHMRRHTGDRPYKCPYCTTIGFFRKKMLKEHIAKGHPQRPMPLELMGIEDNEAEAEIEEEQETMLADSNDSSESFADTRAESDTVGKKEKEAVEAITSE